LPIRSRNRFKLISAWPQDLSPGRNLLNFENLSGWTNCHRTQARRSLSWSGFSLIFRQDWRSSPQNATLLNEDRKPDIPAKTRSTKGRGQIIKCTSNQTWVSRTTTYMHATT